MLLSEILKSEVSLVQYRLMFLVVLKSSRVGLQGRKKEFSSWEHNLETKISRRSTEYFCAKSACA